MILNPNIGEIVEIGDDLYMVFERTINMDSCGECNLKYNVRKCNQILCNEHTSLENQHREYKFIDVIIC